MAVPAGSSPTSPIAASLRQQGVDASAVRAGTYALGVGREVVSGWHSHEVHQLEYAFEGIVHVETATARYLLPPQQAVWIPAGMVHSSTMTNVKAVGVFFDPAMGLPAGDRVRILAAAPVIREMILHAKRWPISRTVQDPMADTFFEALAHLVVEWLDRETPLCLPTSRDPLVAAAMDYTNEHLAEVSLPKVCAAIGASERSLRRAFAAATGISWRRYHLESRLLKAMVLLAQDGQNQNVTAIAIAVGFQSVSAFTRAFGQYAGETPTAYRQRVCAE